MEPSLSADEMLEREGKQFVMCAQVNDDKTFYEKQL